MQNTQTTCDGTVAIGDDGDGMVSVRSQLATSIRLVTGQRGRILVIDDDELARTTVREILESGGHDVVEASSGDMGIRICREELIELVIMDLLMPLKGGLETIEELNDSLAPKRTVSFLGLVSCDSSGPRLRTLCFLEGGEV